MDYFTMSGESLDGNCGEWVHTHGGTLPAAHTHGGRTTPLHRHCDGFMEAFPSSAAEAAADMSVVLPLYDRIDFYEDMGRHMDPLGADEPTGPVLGGWLPWIGAAVVAMMILGSAGAANRPASRREF